MKVAIVHYWLVNIRGGEKVIESLLEIFPDADIFTHVYNPDNTGELVKHRNIYTSRINKLPFAKKLYPLYMPLMPKALMDFNLQDYDLVISSESGPSKGVVPNPDSFHVCYCHSPMRYLWDMYHDYFKNTNFFVRHFMKRLIPDLRVWDIISANMVDCFTANSEYVAKRIKRYYNRDSIVVNPPVDTEKYRTVLRKPQDYYLFFGQLTDYKRADIAIDACVKTGRKLVIAGAGAKKKEIKKYSRNGLISFRGRVSDDEIKNLFSGAKALLFPGIEDFGIIPVEANAAGCPVIAFRGGGALETVKENETGIFFNEQTPESLIAAMDYFEKECKFHNRDVFTEHVKQFSNYVFMEKMKQIFEGKKRI